MWLVARTTTCTGACVRSTHSDGPNSLTRTGMVQTTFFTCANKAYEMFVLPYITSVLVHNDDARVEICLEDADEFVAENAEALAIMGAGLGEGRFHLRNSTWLDVTGVPGNKAPPNSVRFLETPVEATQYTYIGDIDILVLESVTDKHLRRMAYTGRPYSNVLRAGSPAGRALSGLHFTRSDVYYPVRLPGEPDLQRDEHLLYQLVAGRGLELPAPGDGWRPVHGYHLSLGRGPLSPLGWGLASRQRPIWHPWRWRRAVARALSGRSVFNGQQRFRAYRRLQANEVWRGVLPHFDERYMPLLAILELALVRLLHERRLRGRFDAEHAGRALSDRELVRLAVGAPRT